MENENKNPYLIPGALIFAGLIIAGAVIYSVKGPSQVPGQQGSEKAPATASILPSVSSDDLVLGDPKAPVIIVEYADFQCPFCGRFFKDTEAVIRDQYVKTGKVKFIYRDFAFLGPESEAAANAAYCAADQGKFWEYHDYLFNHQNGENQGAFSKENLKSFAKTLGLDENKFSSCVDGDVHGETVKNQTAGGKDAGVNGTPTSFINGKMYVGALPTATITNIIDSLLK